jgi:radical SAM enzyme (TIGR01210 family)
MCDLWQNTTETRVPVGAIPAQIDQVLERLPASATPVTQIKLYNSGNFFDVQAIPREDHLAIIERVRRFETVIVENHPRLCGPQCVEFRDRLERDFEIALGLETVHPEVLPRLNKQMTLDDFDRAIEGLHAAGIRTRAFILLRPPFLSEAEGIEWALRSIEHAFAIGVNCCSLVPTRAGNGVMERLAADGWFAPPVLASLERVLAAGLGMGRGRVFMDVWDAERFATCPRCASERIARLQRMNLTQRAEPPVACSNCE